MKITEGALVSPDLRTHRSMRRLLIISPDPEGTADPFTVKFDSHHIMNPELMLVNS